jgi:hypothetical protein
VRTMLVELDTLLVTLMGAVDASARFMHILLGLPAGQRHHAGWQRRSWRATVASKDHLLAGLSEPGTQLGTGADRHRHRRHQPITSTSLPRT